MNLLSIVTAPFTSLLSLKPSLDLDVPVHGNFCGPGHGDPSQTPIDDTDKACMAHDQGYSDHGYFDIVSDAKLVGNLTKLQFTNLNAEQRAKGLLMIGTFVELAPLDTTISIERAGLSKIGSTAKAGWNKLKSLF